MNSSTKLTFLNHASFMVENDDAVLLIDPWYEGSAFNHGWSLIDTSVKNDDVIKKLIKKNKEIFIWFSHEHSDHFSVPFVKKLKNQSIRLTFLYQKTLDGRVRDFLKKENFEVLELNDGQSFKLGDDFEIKNWKYHSGDSYCWIRCADKRILNLNDCVVSNADEAFEISKKISSDIDFLFTQFGYASWVGNESDKEYRFKVAQEKFERIKVQAEVFNPEFIFPFASFVYFNHLDNFYLNDLQNTPEKLRLAKQLDNFQDKIFFMKPYDELILGNEFETANKLRTLTVLAEHHWGSLLRNIEPSVNEDAIISLDSLRKKYKNYFIKVLLNFCVAPLMLELVGFIKPLKIKITDLTVTVEISYVKGFNILDNNAPYDISIKSQVLDFILSNDYGYNSTSVNGRYRTGYLEANDKFGRFFSPQEYLKNGYGIMSPINSVTMFCKKLVN